MKRNTTRLICWLGTVWMAISIAATAQEIPTKQQAASLQLFGAYSLVQTHYGTANNSGVSVGADLNLRPLSLVQPSLEVRGTFASGSTVTENTYDAGPRLEFNLNRVRPYIYAEIGAGSITFAHPVIYPSGPYSHDNSIVFSGGIGADYMIARQWALRADIMQQRWNLGGGATTTVLHPRIYSFGVDYRFDFNTFHVGHRH